jgi:hypothetical protein
MVNNQPDDFGVEGRLADPDLPAFGDRSRGDPSRIALVAAALFSVAKIVRAVSTLAIILPRRPNAGSRSRLTLGHLDKNKANLSRLVVTE